MGAERRIAEWAAVGLVALGCGGHRASLAGPSGRATVQSPVSSAEEHLSGEAPGSESVDEIVAQALEVVARVRQLPGLGPVRGRLVSRAEMLAVVRAQLAEEVPPAVVEAQEQLLFALDLVPSDFDYLGSIFSLMAEQLAGLYEPKGKAMLLSADLSGNERWAALAHELVHALQDQHYALGQRMKHRAGGGDEQAALQTLAEGDATSLMLDVLGGKAASELDDQSLAWELRGMVQLGSSNGVPAILRRSLVAPYADGVLLVHSLRRRGGWAAVDEVWRDPPRSTEQVLHPEKLAKRELPETVPVPAPPPGGGWQLLDADVMGEQSVRQVFEEWMPRQKAVESASDWAGDQMAAYRRRDEYAVAWQVRYDTIPAAERGLLGFARGILSSASRASGHADPTNVGGMVPEAEGRKAVRFGRICRERPARGPFAAVLTGRLVTVVAGPFRRAKGLSESLGDCATALEWAKPRRP